MTIVPLRSLRSLASGLTTSSSSFFLSSGDANDPPTTIRATDLAEPPLLSRAARWPSACLWFFGRERVKVRRERDEEEELEEREVKPSAFRLTLPSLGSSILSITGTLSMSNFGAVSLLKSASSHELQNIGADLPLLTASTSTVAVVFSPKKGSHASSPSSMRAVFEMECSGLPSAARLSSTSQELAPATPGSPVTPRPMLKEDVFYSPSPSMPTYHSQPKVRSWLSPGPSLCDLPPREGHAIKQMVINGRQYTYRRSDEGASQSSARHKKSHARKPNVNWMRVEASGSKLFRTYGVDDSAMMPSASILMSSKHLRGPKPAGPRIRFADSEIVGRGRTLSYNNNRDFA